MRLTRINPAKCYQYGGLTVSHQINVVELDAGSTATATARGADRDASHQSALGRNGVADDLLQAYNNEEADTEPTEQFQKHHQHQEQQQQQLVLPSTVGLSHDELEHVLGQMAIVVPCKNEDIHIIDAVLSCIPASCLIVLVSNSDRGSSSVTSADDSGCPDSDRPDRYAQEVRMLQRFCRFGRSAIAIHQKDLAAAKAFELAGMPDLLASVFGGEKTIRNGKGEGMILATALTAALCPDIRYIGYVDADNTCPSSVLEYCRAFAAGFTLANTNESAGENAMVRIRWSSKPKAVAKGQIEYPREGRSSRHVNRWLNRLISHIADANGLSNSSHSREHLKGMITTGNAGEHAMTMDLAFKLRLASGYAIEPFHYVDLLERLAPGTHNNTSKTNGNTLGPVKILQIQTRSCHLHQQRGEAHVRKMWTTGLGAIYHHIPHTLKTRAPLVRKEIVEYITQQDNKSSTPATVEATKEDQVPFKEPPRSRVYAPMERLNMPLFRNVVRNSTSLHSFGLHIRTRA